MPTMAIGSAGSAFTPAPARPTKVSSARLPTGARRGQSHRFLFRIDSLASRAALTIPGIAAAVAFQSAIPALSAGTAASLALLPGSFPIRRGRQAAQHLGRSTEERNLHDAHALGEIAPLR